jgi:hypothetical protein
MCREGDEREHKRGFLSVRAPAMDVFKLSIRVHVGKRM